MNKPIRLSIYVPKKTLLTRKESVRNVAQIVITENVKDVRKFKRYALYQDLGRDLHYLTTDYSHFKMQST